MSIMDNSYDFSSLEILNNNNNKDNFDTIMNSTVSIMSLYANKTVAVDPPDSFQYAIWQKVLISMFMFPIIFFSIVGNIIVVIAICKYSYLRVTNNTFLASLAVADCAVGILAMPPNAVQLLSGNWYLRAFACRFWFTCDVLFSTASILHLCCVSIDRYLSISDAYTFAYLKEDPTKSWRVRIMIASVWFVSALLSFVPIFTDLFTTAEHALIIDSLNYQTGQCAFVVNMPYRIISSFVSFWIPGAVMIYFYTRVMMKAYHLENGEFKKYQSVYSDRKASMRHMSDSAIQVNTTNQVLLVHNGASRASNAFKEANGVDESEALRLARNSQQDLAKNWRREYRLIKTLGIVMAVFCLCWVFFFLRYTFCDRAHGICPESIANNLVLEDILFWIGYFNSAVNPFLYNYTNRDFRRAFRSLLRIRNRSDRLPSLTSSLPASRKTTQILDESKILMK